MTEDRYRELDSFGAFLTDEEVMEGWHFCPDWDDMLVGPGMEAMDSCLCARAGQP